MPSSRITETADVLEKRQFSGPARWPRVLPQQLCLDGLEERLHRRAIMAIAFAAHRYLEAVLTQPLLVVVRLVLRSVGCMQPFCGWRKLIATVSARITRSLFIRYKVLPDGCAACSTLSSLS